MLEKNFKETVWIGNEFTLNGNLKLQINCLQSQDPGQRQQAGKHTASQFFMFRLGLL